jgi:hypothetical protein
MTSFDFYKLAVEARNLELRLFWNRSLFFGGFILALFVGYYNVAARPTAGEEPAFAKALIPTFGVLFSFAWSLANRGSKYWYESWESKILECERLLDVRFFGDWQRPQRKSWLFRARLYSVSKIAIFLSDLVLLGWLTIFLWQTRRDWIEWIFSYELHLNVVDVVLLALACVLWYCTRTTVPPEILQRWRRDP